MAHYVFIRLRYDALEIEIQQLDALSGCMQHKQREDKIKNYLRRYRGNKELFGPSLPLVLLNLNLLNAPEKVTG